MAAFRRALVEKFVEELRVGFLIGLPKLGNLKISLQGGHTDARLLSCFGLTVRGQQSLNHAGADLLKFRAMSGHKILQNE